MSSDVSVPAGLEQFRRSLIDDVYLPADFLPWSEIEQEVADSAGGLELLRAVSQADRVRPEALAAAMVGEPTVFKVVMRLLATPGGVGFGDGRRLPDAPPRTPAEADAVSQLLLDLGLGRLLRPETNLADLLRVSLIGADARRRGYRRRDTLSSRFDRVVLAAVKEASAEVGDEITSGRPSQLPSLAAPRVRTVLSVQDRPVAALATVFEAIGGGRQTQSLAGYVQVQEELDTVPVGLVLIADGRGVKEVPVGVLRRVWENVGAMLSISQAESGALTETIVSFARSGWVTRRNTLPVETIIVATLAERTSVSTGDLPVGREAAELALARYEAEHPELALVLEPSEGRLSWRRSTAVERIDALGVNFDAAAALEVVAKLLTTEPEPASPAPDGDRPSTVIVPPANPLLPARVFAAAQDGAPDADAIREVSRLSREHAPEAPVALLVVPDAAAWLEHPDRALTTRTTATSVVVLDPAATRRIAEDAAPPEEGLAAQVLRQADLTKASPFVHSGVTPARVFAGRGSEEASIVADLGASSVALLGSRRIGKTSLMRRVEQTLRGQGRTVYYGDCQAIGDWEGFVRLARRKWGVELAATFEPDQLAELASRLSTADDAPVFILDEVDRLVAWDQQNEVAGVSEAFFRALRALSQADDAQFLFSGERTIADRLWSPHSPHWNFTQRLSLRQLDRQSAAKLLFGVLASLTVSFDDEATAEALLWRATSGHPRLVQLIGDRLVQRLNERPADERGQLSVADMQTLVDGFDYRREYLETYWGQATPYERQLGEAVASGRRTFAQLRTVGDGEEDDLGHALRVLELYGIIDLAEDGVVLRAEFFPEALGTVGRESAAVEA